ncbi:MAG: hypothetical protein HPY55_10240 [Firmicutes bacterium]|nr:hypothetical protein [Bacillota bacterium]
MAINCHVLVGPFLCDARGNITVVAGFNIHADPEAAAVVFQSGIPITMVPWETTLKALFGAEGMEVLERSDRPLAQTFLKASRTTASAWSTSTSCWRPP